MTATACTRAFWAKSDRENPQRIHLLEHHMADVGVCFEALLAQPTIGQGLARAGGLDRLDDATAARLAVFAALHDIGKVNIGFQTQIWQPADAPADKKMPHRAGHIADLTPVLNGTDATTSAWFFDALGWWDDLLSWDAGEGETVCGLFIAALSHHGSPLQLGGRHPNPKVWRDFGKLHPRSHVEHLSQLVRHWFPLAFRSDAPPLPSTSAFQHMFLGLCILADWIGSDERNFPFCAEPRDNYVSTARQNAQRAVSEIGLNLKSQRTAFRTLRSEHVIRSTGRRHAHSLPALPDFGPLFSLPNATPNPVQQVVRAVPTDERLVIIESETGSGKTEAALWRFAQLYQAELVDGLYFALPTRAAASQMHARVTRFIANLFPDKHRPEPVLAVPGYLRAGTAEGRQLPNYEVWWDDDPGVATGKRRWAAESAKRYLAAQIAVGTVDQAMMAALKVKHAHLRAACLARHLLIVDEVHASDPYMRAILKALLDAHIGAGGYAVLMSATLGAVARRRWVSGLQDLPPLGETITAPYPAVTTQAGGGEQMIAVAHNEDKSSYPNERTATRFIFGKEKTVQIEATAMDDFAQVAERALHAARTGAKVLVIRNTVGHAINTQQTLEKTALSDERGLLYACNGTPTLHHGRFAASDRRHLDRAVEEQLGKDRPAGGRIIVGTQTLEQSLDIDADLLITDLCPMDVLLQRIGRLHRHQRHDRPPGYETPSCVVLLPAGVDLSPLLAKGVNVSPSGQSDDTFTPQGPGRNGLGPHGHVYKDLRILEATRRLIVEHAENARPWRIPEMNRELVERTTHPEALEAITTELGDAWRDHANSMMGAELAEGLTARSAIVRRDKSFFTDNQDVVFGSLEEKIRTRLGDEGIAVELEPAPSSPFTGETISQIAIPNHLARDLASDEPVAPELTAGGFTFRLGDARFQYDRLGLRRM